MTDNKQVIQSYIKMYREEGVNINMDDVRHMKRRVASEVQKEPKQKMTTKASRTRNGAFAATSEKPIPPIAKKNRKLKRIVTLK